MKMNIGKILALLLAVTMVFALVPAVSADAAEPQTWTDDFGSGKGGSYTPYGWWWNMDGVLTVGDERAGAGVCYYWLNDYVWDDFVMEFDVISQTSEFGVILRAQNTTDADCQNYGYGVLSDTNWAFFMAENGGWFGFDTLVDGQRWANSVEGYGWATQPGANNVHWKIVAKGDRIEVYFNHAEVPQMVMDASLYESGAIGFRTYNPGGAVTAVVDNLTITEIVETEPVDPNPEVPENPVNPEDPEEPDDPENPVDPEDPEEPEVIEPVVQPQQTWTDDFNSDKGGSYTPYGIFWNQNGALTIGDENSLAGWTYYYLNDYVWGDFTMEFDVVGQSNSFGAVIRANNPGAGPDDGDGYAIMSDRAYVFVGKLSGTWQQVTTPEESYACPHPGDSVHWKIVAQGDTISVYFDYSDVPSIVVKDDTWSSGQIGFRCLVNQGQTAATVKNLVVTQDGSPNTGDSIGASILAAFGISTAALVVLAVNKRRFAK